MCAERREGYGAHEREHRTGQTFRHRQPAHYYNRAELEKGEKVYGVGSREPNP